MALEGFSVRLVERKDIRGFVETYHYSGSINGVISDYCFALYRGDELVGAAIFGRMAMANQWRPYGDSAEEVTELRRLCCIDDTPKNTESFFIGKALRWLKIHTKLKVVVSYSDAEYGHQGTIYRASNFEFVGSIPGARVIMFEGRRYHDKTIRTKYNGVLKPFAKRVKDALESGAAYYKNTAGKNAFVFRLRKK